MDEKQKRIELLVRDLNKYRDAYYNKNESLISDEEYDNLFDELKSLEEETGYYLPNSPSTSVGYTVQSQLNKVVHDHPMLSLDKTKDVNDIIKFANGHDIVMSAKMDGLTCSLHYDETGKLVKAETRGNGEIGEDILLNALQVSNIPKKINNKGIPFTVDGEIIIDKTTFNEINSKLEEPFSHPRNLAAGSIRQLDTKITAERKLKFIAWRVIAGNRYSTFFMNLAQTLMLGFEKVDDFYIDKKDLNIDHINELIETIKTVEASKGYPIDGLVFTYDDLEYANKLGSTSHHPLHSIAFKFYDDEYETRLKDIEWQVGRTGVVTPVAIFEPVEIDGTIIERASIHNLSVMEEKLGRPAFNQKIWIAKMNQIIPQITRAEKCYSLNEKDYIKIPEKCPSCGERLVISRTGIANMLVCTNKDCSSKLVAKFAHFASKEGMNIEGLSEASIEDFMNLDILKNYEDFYTLKDHKEEILKKEGWGEKSFDNLIEAINKSKEVSLSNFLCAISIPLVGKTACKKLSGNFNGDFELLKKAFESGTDFTSIEDFGQAIQNSLYEFWNKEMPYIIEHLAPILTFTKETQEKRIESGFINGKTFVITGALSKPRSFYEKYIEEHGGKLAGSVSKKTDYLFTNGSSSGSSKAKKALELGIPIISEEEFNKKAGEK